MIPGRGLSTGVTQYEKHCFDNFGYGVDVLVNTKRRFFVRK